MKLKELINILRESGINYTITLCEDLEVKAQVHKLKINNYLVKIRKEFENDRITMRVLLKHELGHIYYHHLDDIENRVNKLVKFIKSKPDLDQELNKYNRNQIISETLNIIEDFEINTTLLNKVEEKLKICTCLPEAFGLKRGLKNKDYYEPVIRYLISSNSNNDINNIRDQLLELVANIIKSPDNNDGKPIEIDGSKLPPQVLEELINGDDNSDGDADTDTSTTVVITKIPGVSGTDKINWDAFKVIPSRKTILFNYLRDYVFKYKMVRTKVIDPSFDEKKGRLKGVFRPVKVPVKCIKKLRKYAIIVDISGSMDSLVVNEVLNCIVSMRNSDYIDRNSVLIYCNHQVQRVIKLTQEVKSPRVDGGTELHLALDTKYIPSDIDDIVIVTDMGTDINALIEKQKLFNRSRFWGILYSCSTLENVLKTIFHKYKIF